MSNKKKLVTELIRSLTEDYSEWYFDSYVATNRKSKVQIWITGVPILSLGLYQPTPINFSLFDKIRIYKALDECRSLYVLSLNCH